MKQSRYIFPGLASIAILVLFSCLGSSSRGDFVVDTPKGWTRVDTVERDSSREVTFYAPFGRNYQGFTENISISIIPSDWNIDLYSTIVMKMTKAETVFYEELKKGELKISGRRAKWFQTLIIYKNRPTDKKFEQKTYFVQGKNNIYMIVCTSGKGYIGIIQPDIDKVINSFRIIND